MLISAVHTLSSLSTGLLSSDSAVCSCSFPTCWVDVACLQVTFADMLVPKDRPSFRFEAGGELSIQQVLGDLAILHAAGVAKPAQPPLCEQSEHVWYPHLCQDVHVWDTVLPGNAQDLPEAAHVEGVDS